MTVIQPSPVLAPKPNDTPSIDTVQKQAQLISAALGSHIAARLPPQLEKQVLGLKSLEQQLASIARIGTALANQVPPPRSMLAAPTQLAGMSVAEVNQLLTAMSAQRSASQAQVRPQDVARMNSIIDSASNAGLVSASARDQHLAPAGGQRPALAPAPAPAPPQAPVNSRVAIEAATTALRGIEQA